MRESRYRPGRETFSPSHAAVYGFTRNRTGISRSTDPFVDDGRRSWSLDEAE
ncbi:hypothetical protein HLASF_0760 [Halanaeroarchaeum sulfurireducens]|uniref:Uncharacterized protein n=1 Tax=Halanaeroarchaeum sulfurireducens TaxID=1604004 RepID=A0A0F7P7Y6_9EURY|nr:hypothetical protein HLASF_0760 [Halanaeroarchaeum sulfurireducens]ALG81658.1 hypothetical protein HLASA_0757 [Halanaeroarchaeum sulfurireducens]